MELQELIANHPDIPPSILKTYVDADEYVVLNQDPSLHPVWIKVPPCPSLNEIDGFGLSAKQQKFVYQVFPKKLQKLVDNSATIDNIWNTLENNQHEYRKEISWIRRQWQLRETGYWFFCNGKPTHIVWWHYVYLNFWKFKTGAKPQYRDKNRKFYAGLHYAYTTKEAPIYEYTEGDTKKQNPKVVYEDAERRIPKMRDTGFRTILGVAHPKERKEGASNMCLCAQYMEVITHIGVIGGIISSSGKHAKEKMFDDIVVPGWNNMPFFFKPRSTSNKNPEAEIKFNASRQRADKIGGEELGSSISHSPTTEATLYDGGNNIWINVDEAGKAEMDVYKRHEILKPCVSLGSGSEIFGFLSYPSTVGDMTGIGAPRFFDICQDSHFEKRDLSGQTVSGMMVIYLPAYEGLQGFVGEYGESIIETPTPEQAKFIGKDYGARQHLMDQRANLLKDKNAEKYNEKVRQFPIKYMECFRTEDGDIGFNTQIINETYDDVCLNEQSLGRYGNFEWRGGKMDTEVYWEDDPRGFDVDHKPKWFITKILNKDETNRFIIRKWTNPATGETEDQRFPVDPNKYTSCGDPFAFGQTKTQENSDGGGAVFINYDPAIDSGKNIEDWQTYTYVATYLHRPSTDDEYCEDMLKADIYYGSMQFPEVNIRAIWKWYEKRGYAGYLKYDIDLATKKLKSHPGIFSLTDSKQELFQRTRTYIQDHGRRVKHKRLLLQWKEIQHMTQMTKFDLLTAAGGVLIGAPPILHLFRGEQKQEPKTEMLYPMMSYR